VIVENEQSKRSTPSSLSFTDQGREYGYNALKNQAKRPESTVVFIHNLLGSQETDYFSRTFQPLTLIPNTERNSTLIQITKDSYETEEITAMILEYIKEMSEKFGEGSIKDCSITIPSFWTRAQRIAVISAANAAGLNVLALMHENAGAALYYGIDRMDNVTEHFVIFYNLGASYLQVTLVKYGVASKKAAAGKQIENVEILAHAFDETLGGSLFDSILAKYIAGKFQEKHGIDLLQIPRAMVRVFTAANQAKKTLSANKNTLVMLNSIHKGIDFSFTLTRDEFEKILEPFHERLVDPVVKVLETAGLKAKDVNNLEIIGGVSRIPKVQEVIKEKTGLDISTHLNGDESVAHGSAIYAANFSSVVQVKPMWLTDISISSFSAKFYSEADLNWSKEAVLFKEGAKLANKKKITFNFNRI
jgi:hypoxia up-regulated 1